MENYKEKYESLIEAVKQLQKANPSDEGIQNWVNDNVPELRESEDEKVMKKLIHLVKKSNEQGGYALHKWEADEMLAWLEKQKEPELSEDFGEYVAELSKQFPEVSFAKLSRIAVRVKNWLEKQGQKPTTIDIDKMVDDYANNKERGNEEFGKPVNCMVRAYRQGLTDALSPLNLEKQGEQKPTEWSEDYTERMGQIINYLKCQAKEEPTRKRTLLGWVMLLKSIFRKGLPEIQIPGTEAARKGIHRIMDVLDWAADKGRISDSDCEDYMILLSAYLPQPKSTWSKEDEKRIKKVMHILSLDGRISNEELKSILDWFKSLKQRHTWKPTEEQMRALHDMNLTGNISYAGQGQTLIELYNDLKKL